MGAGRKARIDVRVSWVKVLHVDKNVYPIPINGLRRLFVGEWTNVVEAIEGAPKPGAHFLAIVSSGGIGVQFEKRMVTSLERFDEQERRGVVLKVVGEIA